MIASPQGVFSSTDPDASFLTRAISLFFEKSPPPMVWLTKWLYAVTRQSPFLSPFQPNAAVGPPSARPPLKTTRCQLEWKLILETAALMLL